MNDDWKNRHRLSVRDKIIKLGRQTKFISMSYPEHELDAGLAFASQEGFAPRFVLPPVNRSSPIGESWTVYTVIYEDLRQESGYDPCR